MIAWKLLHAGAVGLFSGFEWPTPTATVPGAWVEVTPPLRPSIHGIHAVGTAALLDWLDDELWEIELDSEIVEENGLLVASRGRLLRRILAWDAHAANALTASCVVAVREAVSRELARSGAGTETAITAAFTNAENVTALVSQLTPGDEVQVAGLVYIADCVALAAGGRPEGFDDHPGRDLPTTPAAIAANVGWVAAASVGTIAARMEADPEAFERGFGRERTRQQAWLADRLMLDGRS